MNIIKKKIKMLINITMNKIKALNNGNMAYICNVIWFIYLKYTMIKIS